MWFYGIIAVLLSISLYTSASDVVHCTDDDFEDTVASAPISLVKFYAPWCGHCKKMAPEIETAATALANNDPPVKIIKVDCTVHTKVCGKFGVSGYPTLKIFRNSAENPEDYNGGREADDIIKTMRSKAGPSSKDLDSVATAEKYFGKLDGVAVVGFFADKSSKFASSHQKAADQLSESFKFAYSHSKEVNDQYGFKDTIVLYRPKHLANKFEDDKVVYDGKDSVSAVKDWIKETAYGMCGHRTKSNAKDFSSPLVAVYYDVDYVRNPKGTNYWRNRVLKVAKKLIEEGKQLTFSVNNKEDFGDETEEFGVTFTDKPVVGMRDAANKKYAMKEAFAMDTLEAFIRRVLSGEEPEHLKSEDIPTSDDEGVTVVVAKNFNEIVNDPTKDVLIEFYAPWCGHCKSLAPKYSELAKKLADEPNIVIAKMDATANDVPKPYDVKGFPTIYFAPKNSKDSPKSYDSDREVNGFIKYLAKEATDELVGYKRNGKPKKKEL